jgi:membrane protein DedA with SNARE-associated domain
VIPFHVPTDLGYGVLFVLILIESAGVPVPGETSLITAGVLASAGQLSLSIVIGVASGAAIVGDNLGYFVGYRAGHWALTRPGRWSRARRHILDDGEQFFGHHGGKTVFFGRWLPVLRFTAALLAGTNEMPWRRFVLFNALGGLAWAATIGSSAYVLGAQASTLVEAIGLGGLLALILTVGGHLAWRRSRRGQQARPCGGLSDFRESTTPDPHSRPTTQRDTAPC